MSEDILYTLHVVGNFTPALGFQRLLTHSAPHLGISKKRKRKRENAKQHYALVLMRLPIMLQELRGSPAVTVYTMWN